MCACLARQVQKQATGILLPLFSQQNHLLFSSGPKSQSLCVEASTLSLPSADGEPHPRCRPAERAVSAAVVSERRPSAWRVACCGSRRAPFTRANNNNKPRSKSSQVQLAPHAPARAASTQQQHLPPDALLVIVTNRSSPRQHTQKSRKKLYQLPELAGHARRKRPPRVRERAAQSTSRVGCWASAIIAAHHHFHFGRLSPSRITWTSAGCSTATAM